MTFGRLPRGQSLKRAVPGEPTLRMGSGEDSFRGDAALHVEGGVWNGASEREIPNIPAFWGTYGHQWDFHLNDIVPRRSREMHL